LTRTVLDTLVELETVRGLGIEMSEAALAANATDFGRLVQGKALAVVRPSSTDHLRELVAWASRHGHRLTPRGGGMSQSGQSVANGSVSVDMRHHSGIATPDAERRTVVCGSGATWRNVLEQTLRSRLAPRVSPLNLDLTVGGTLSAGGFGTTSHRNGVAVSKVTRAEVVLGTGEVVQCGPSTRRDVFDAVLGGAGRAGIISNVEIQLEPVPDALETSFLLYEDLDAMLADQTAIVASGCAFHLESFCSASIQGLRRGPSGRRLPLTHWLYGLHVTVTANAGAEATELVNGLRFTKRLHVEQEPDYAAFASRYDVRFEGMRATGAWEHAHPWYEALLPFDCAAAVVRRALEILPPFFGDGHRVLTVAETDHPAAMAFPERGPFAIFGVFPTGVPPVLRAPALAALAKVNEAVVEAGGKRYLSGWLFEMSTSAWQTHYGNTYGQLVEAQRRFDPNGVFRSMLAPLSHPQG
jgi:cytokinin dehydrogenase